MKISIDMPAVSQCDIEDCTYNIDDNCHARAITIGGGDTPNCDTLFCGAEHVHNKKIKAGVGACKVTSCSHNDDLECGADSIQVGFIDDDVRCLTYKML